MVFGDQIRGQGQRCPLLSSFGKVPLWAKALVLVSMASCSSGFSRSATAEETPRSAKLCKSARNFSGKGSEAKSHNTVRSLN